MTTGRKKMEKEAQALARTHTHTFTCTHTHTHTHRQEPLKGVISGVNWQLPSTIDLAALPPAHLESTASEKIHTSYTVIQ